MDIEMIKNQFEEYVERWDGRIIDRGMCGAIVGCLDKACGRKEDRHLVLKQLTGHASSKDLSSAQWYALYMMVMPYKPEGGKWQAGVGEENLELLCHAILNTSLDQPGQMKIKFPEFEALKETTAADWEAHVESPKSQETYEPPF